jgi:hypothetical protein
MSTPEQTAETPELDTTARERQDTLTSSVGTRLETPASGVKAPWWKRLLGQGK